MRFASIPETQEKTFDSLATHPLQSVPWGTFRNRSGVTVERIGIFEGTTLVDGVQITTHRLPFSPYTIGYFPKGSRPTTAQLQALRAIGKKERCLFIKLEPNVSREVQGSVADLTQVRTFLFSEGLVKGKSLFTPYTFQVDLTQSEAALLASMKSKTRYNVRVAERHGVEVREDNSPQAFAAYLKLMAATTKRQGFYAHSIRYHKLMWETLHPAGIARLLTARWQGKILVAWIVFVFHDTLYYPYGASSTERRELMASNLMLWEAIRYGKRLNLKTFDLWGCLGPEPDTRDPWYGFHHFKEGYGPKLIEFVGSFDLVLRPTLYRLFQLADKGRDVWLRLLARVRSLIRR